MTLPLVGFPCAHSGLVVAVKNLVENPTLSRALANCSRMLLPSRRRTATLILGAEFLFPTALPLFSKPEADLDERDSLGDLRKQENIRHWYTVAKQT
jgi:hypothetical protein